MFALILGLFMGAVLFAVKWCSFWLLTSKKNPHTGEMEQRVLKRWLLFGRYQPVRDRIHESTLMLFIQDLVWGYIGMHAFAIAGASNLAFIALTAYSTTCMTTLMWEFLVHKVKRTIKSWTPTLPHKTRKKKKYSWEEDYA